MARGKAIEMLLVDGTPGGITTVRINGSTSKIIAASRSDIGELKDRPELNRNGVYFLLGDDVSSVENTWCYIGKTENLGQRLVDHQQKKSEWQRLVFCYSDDESYNEGHWGYLEHRLIEMAQKAGRCSMPENKQIPKTRKLSEAQRVAVANLLDEIKILLPLLGVNVLRSAETNSPASSRPESSAAAKAAETDDVRLKSPVFYLKMPWKAVDAQLQEVDRELFLLEGSRLIGAWDWDKSGMSDSTNRTYSSLAQRHQDLLEDGALRTEGRCAVLTRNVVISSVSIAAGVCAGGSYNGKEYWKTEDGVSFGDWLNSRGV
ncbi:GIY-YIG nuclease family protein [Corynebacterium lizhenjunii]|uniref:GIY-YIG nuclease family protein n=1 Tax=Corynebacterium lizhenjunii TaxID=2709394 RepID=UPI0013ECB705|nr:GIY-YIG nuclease family protein [Corynebacterium lizhenjunii]